MKTIPQEIDRCPKCHRIMASDEVGSWECVECGYYKAHKNYVPEDVEPEENKQEPVRDDRICDECGEGKSPHYNPSYSEYKLAGDVAQAVCPNMCELR